MSATQLLTVDFETYYDRDYSLSKLTTEEYVRDSRFEVIGVAVKRNSDPVEWFSGTHQETAQWLGQFDWGNSLVLAHNTMFDSAILSWRFNTIPLGWLDTMSMAQAILPATQSESLANLATYYDIGVKGTEVINALGKTRSGFTQQELARYADYCRLDVELTYDLFNKLIVGFPKQELKLIDRKSVV